MSQLTWKRLSIGIGALGAGDAMLAETIKCVKERKFFDQRLMDFQNTRFKLCEAKTKQIQGDNCSEFVFQVIPPFPGQRPRFAFTGEHIQAPKTQISE